MWRGFMTCGWFMACGGFMTCGGRLGRGAEGRVVAVGENVLGFWEGFIPKGELGVHASTRVPHVCRCSSPIDTWPMLVCGRVPEWNRIPCLLGLARQPPNVSLAQLPHHARQLVHIVYMYIATPGSNAIPLLSVPEPHTRTYTHYTSHHTTPHHTIPTH